MREVCVDGQAEMTPFVGEAPALDWVPVTSIVIDDTYQRPLGKSNWASIRKIAQNFDWSMFSPVLLAALGNGRYAVIDGQHRLHAARLRHISLVPAMIVQAGRSGQARAFSWVNGSVTKITTFHVYKAALAAEEDWAVRARDAVAAGDCQLMTFNKSAAQKRSGEIYSIALIKELILAGKDTQIANGLGALRDYDVSRKRVALYCADLIRPWLESVGKQSRDDLRQILAENDPFVMMDRVDTGRKSGDLKGPSRTLYKNAFSLAIRAGRRKAA